MTAENERPKVWIASDAGHDFSEAEKYGDLVAVTNGKSNIFNIRHLVSDFAEKLTDFGPEDYLLLSGNVVVNVLLSSILLQKQETIQVLIFDAVHKGYVPREISLKTIKKELNS